MAGSSHSYRLAADVGLLSRNIRITGQDYAQMFQESFGARVLVGTFSSKGIEYKGKEAPAASETPTKPDVTCLSSEETYSSGGFERAIF